MHGQYFWEKSFLSNFMHSLVTSIRCNRKISNRMKYWKVHIKQGQVYALDDALRRIIEERKYNNITFGKQYEVKKWLYIGNNNVIETTLLGILGVHLPAGNDISLRTINESIVLFLILNLRHVVVLLDQ